VFVQLVSMREYEVLKLLELACVMREDALDYVVVELFLIEKARLVEKDEVLLEVLHHVPLAEQVSGRGEGRLNASAH